jgi:hypothetical protein
MDEASGSQPAGDNDVTADYLPGTPLEVVYSPFGERRGPGEYT